MSITDVYDHVPVPEPPVITGTQASYDTNELTGLIVNYRASTKVRKNATFLNNKYGREDIDYPLKKSVTIGMIILTYIFTIVHTGYIQHNERH